MFSYKQVLSLEASLSCNRSLFHKAKWRLKWCLALDRLLNLVNSIPNPNRTTSYKTCSSLKPCRNFKAWALTCNSPFNKILLRFNSSTNHRTFSSLCNSSNHSIRNHSYRTSSNRACFNRTPVFRRRHLRDRTVAPQWCLMPPIELKTPSNIRSPSIKWYLNYTRENFKILCVCLCIHSI